MQCTIFLCKDHDISCYAFASHLFGIQSVPKQDIDHDQFYEGVDEYHLFNLWMAPKFEQILDFCRSGKQALIYTVTLDKCQGALVCALQMQIDLKLCVTFLTQADSIKCSMFTFLTKADWTVSSPVTFLTQAGTQKLCIFMFRTQADGF